MISYLGAIDGASHKITNFATTIAGIETLHWCGPQSLSTPEDLVIYTNLHPRWQVRVCGILRIYR